MACASNDDRDESLVPAEAWAMLGRRDLEAYTLWDFPSQGFGPYAYGDSSFNGVTPARCVMNLVRRYTRPGEWVVDPMAGSGTVPDVARALGRRTAPLDLAPRRRDIVRADARASPLRSDFASLVIVDPPYSDNVRYSPDAHCLGRVSCRDPRFFAEMRRVAAEAHRILRPGGILAWIVSDEYRHQVYTPVGFRILSLLSETFTLVDTVALVRHHDRSATPLWEHRARRFNFFLRGFKFLFLVRKPDPRRGGDIHGTSDSA